MKITNAIQKKIVMIVMGAESVRTVVALGQPTVTLVTEEVVVQNAKDKAATHAGSAKDKDRPGVLNVEGKGYVENVKELDKYDASTVVEMVFITV